MSTEGERPPAPTLPKITGPHTVIRLSAAREEAVDALERSGLLDSPRSEPFDRLTRLASTIIGVPVALITLVDRDRQFFKSAQGLPEPWASVRETPLSHSFCQHVVERQAPLLVEDARVDARVRGNRAIDDFDVIAYAGVPVRAADGTIIGSLCAIDTKPRPWSPRDVEILQELASLAHTEIALLDALRSSEASRHAVQAASAELAAVIESSTDGIYTIDGTGACMLVNSAAAAALGYPADELLGRNMHELVHHHHADGRIFDEEECPLYLASSSGAPVWVEQTPLWRSDGTSFPAECSSSPLTVNGMPAGAAVTFRDISERLTAADALRDSELRFRAVFRDAGIAIVITALDGVLLECNDAYVRLTGYTREELTSSTFYAVTHPEDAIVQRRLADEMLAGARDQLHMEKRYVRKGGELAWGRLTATLMRDAEGVPRYIVGAVEDITATRRAAEAIALLSDAGAILSVSLELEQPLAAMARRALPLLGEACIVDILRADGSREAVCAHRDEARDAEVADARARADSSASALAALGLDHCITATVRGRERELAILTFGAAHRTYTPDDIHLAEELAARVAAAMDNALLFREARNATRARDDVLAVVSHDLRNPVHTITMSAALLTDVPELPPATVTSQLEIIKRSARRADRLIRDLLDVTRIENGQLQLDLQAVPAADIVAEAAQMIEAQARQREVDVRLGAPEASVVVQADRHRLLQALDNLLGNALKFTPAHGTIDIAARRDGNAVWFEVRDSGSGVPPDQQANLFTRFWQARVGDRRGVGLGLTIVKGIVDAHGGRIEVESDGHSGTAIRFTVPAWQPAEVTA